MVASCGSLTVASASAPASGDAVPPEELLPDEEPDDPDDPEDPEDPEELPSSPSVTSDSEASSPPEGVPLLLEQAAAINMLDRHVSAIRVFIRTSSCVSEASKLGSVRFSLRDSIVSFTQRRD
jgi:hypothetical protein